MKTLPVAGALGAEITGLDLASLGGGSLEELREAVHAYEVVFVRGAHLNEDDHLAFGRRLGDVQVFPVAKLLGASEPTTTVIRDGPRGLDTDHWHTDVTWIETPPDYAVLQALEVPERGGDTLWASTTAAFEALSPLLQERLEGLEVRHDNESFIRGVRRASEPGAATDGLVAALREQYPPVVHPLVRTHPQTGRRALYLGGDFMRGIVGMSDAESQALLGFLQRHIEDPRFHCRWSWQVGDVAIWDERSTNHRSAGDHFPQARALRRIEVRGPEPH